MIQPDTAGDLEPELGELAGEEPELGEGEPFEDLNDCLEWEFVP